MTIDFAELENDAKRFFELKHSEKTASELNNIAIKIIDEISLPPPAAARRDLQPRETRPQTTPPQPGAAL